MESSHDYCCSRKPKGFLVSRETREAFQPNCNAYFCPHCGPIKARRLAKGVLSEFEASKIRLLTLTTTNAFNTDRFDLTTAAWKEFSRLFRASSRLSLKQRRCRYARFVERHKNGSVHLHIIIDEYLPVRVVQAIWQQAVERALKRRNVEVPKRKICNAHIRGARTGWTHRDACRYVTKYVTKEARHGRTRLEAGKQRTRPYSASRNVSVWRQWRADHPKTGTWSYVKFSAIRDAGELYLSLPSLIPGEDWQGNKQFLTIPLFNVLFPDEFVPYSR